MHYSKTQHKKELIRDNYRETRQLLEDLLPENHHKVEVMCSLNKVLEESLASFSLQESITTLETESVVRSAVKRMHIEALSAK